MRMVFLMISFYRYRRTHGQSPHKRGRTASSSSTGAHPSSPNRRQIATTAYKFGNFVARGNELGRFVPVPTESEIDKLILAKKKQLLVQQYVSEKDKEEQKETEEMMSTEKAASKGGH